MTAVVLLALGFGASFSEVAIACKDRVLSGFFPVDELASYENVFVVHVEKVVLARPRWESWYTPSFTFEAKVLKSLKGAQQSGTTIRGRTSSDDEPRARCSITLEAGRDYLLMLNRQGSPFLLPRYGSPYVSSDDPDFHRYVAEIESFYATR